MSDLLRLESTLNCISVSLDVATDLLPRADGTVGPGSVPQSVAKILTGLMHNLFLLSRQPDTTAEKDRTTQ